MARYFPNDPWKIALTGETFSLTGWGQGICSCHHSLMSWVLFMSTANQPATCLFLQSQVSPTIFKEMSMLLCPSQGPLSFPFIPLSPPSLSGLLPLHYASSCPDSTAHGVPLSSLLPAYRETGAKSLLPLLEVRAFPLLQPGLTQCLQSKPVTEQHCS